MSEEEPPQPAATIGSRWLTSGAFAAMFLASLSLWLFREPLFSGQVLFRRDILLVRYAEIEAFVRAVAEGAWPLWNPNLSFGRPLLGDPGAQVAYPPTWLNLVLQPWTYYALYVWSHALFSAISLHALGRRLGLSPTGAVLAAALWMFSGPYVSQVDLWHHFGGASWLPAVLLASDVALGNGSSRAALAWGVAQGGQALAGSADACLLTLLATAVLAWARRSGRPPLAMARVAALAGAVAAGLAAVVWLPALEQVRHAARLDLPLAMRTYWSLHPASALDLLLPGLLASVPLRPDLAQALFESREPFFSSLYLGAASMVFVILAAADRRPLGRSLALLAAASLLLSFGKNTPVYEAVAAVLPPIRILRYPVKLATLAAFCWALLAGIGFDAWKASVHDASRRARRLLLPQLVLAATGFLAAGSLWWRPEVWLPFLASLPAGVPPSLVLSPLALRVTITAATAMAVVVLLVLRERIPHAGLAAAALATAELAFHHRHPNPTAPAALVRHDPAVLSYVRHADSRVYVYDYGVPGKARSYLGRDDGYRLARQPQGWDFAGSMALGMQMYLAPETSGRFGVRGSFDVDYRGLYPHLLDRLCQMLRYVEGRPEHRRLLELAGVTEVIALHEEGFRDLVPLATVPGLFTEPIRVFRVPGALPRAYAVGRVRVADGLATLTALLAEDFDPAREVVLPQRPGSDASDAFRGTVRITSARSDRVVLEAELDEPGYVVLADGYDPGWRAAIDGRSAPLLQANAVFRAVAVPAGRRRIELLYRPTSVLVGLAGSGLTVVAAAALFIASAPKRSEGIAETAP